MAIGDDALAAGMTLVNGNTPNSAPAIDDYINETRDLIAQRTSAIMPIAKGGTGQTTAAAARGALGAAPTTHTHRIGDILTSDGSGSYADALQTQLTGISNALQTQLTGISNTATTANSVAANVAEGILNATSYNRGLTGSYRVAYLGSTGLLGWVSSSRRYKQDIASAPIDVQAVLAMDVVTFRYIEGDGTIQHGLIAEDLEALGLTWLVDYGEDGDTPQGVRYDLLALALLPAIQSAHTRLDAIETHLDAIGASLDAPTD
ncbi:MULTISPECIES: tail fiber domain-containing protein [unclassified Microbacterium]|uniref:tail fiber domain-containing protein n=1 Tax=unclassified Microbacterium TaxID=2609290 RepID=UPI00301A53EE